MTRIIERRQDAGAVEDVFELRVFQLRDGDVRACAVPAELAVTFEMMAEMREPVAQAYLDALSLCEAEGVSTLWVHDPLVSEASRDLPVDLAARHPNIPWQKAAGIGNVLRHNYESIAAAVIWKLAHDDFDSLEEVRRAEFDAIQGRGA